VRLQGDEWQLGQYHVCRVVEEVPPKSIASWRDTDGHMYSVSKSTVPHLSPGQTVKPYYKAGSSAALWKIRDWYCKVKLWTPGVQIEQATIRYVQAHLPQVPVPDVYCGWTEGSRSFLMMRAADGTTLNDAWKHLTEEQRTNVAEKIVEYCSLMSQKSSALLQSIDGFGFCDQYLQRPNTPRPSLSQGNPQTPFVFGPICYDQAVENFSPMPVEHLFTFQHADLNPSNIIINVDSEKLSLTILDWEHAGFHNKGWDYFKTVTYGFQLELEGKQVKQPESNAWARLLRSELEKRQLGVNFDDILTWIGANGD
jgi:hypothetical protein